MMPEIVRAAAEPMGNIQNLTVLSNDGASDVVKNVTRTVTEANATVKGLTGIDIPAMLNNALGGEPAERRRAAAERPSEPGDRRGRSRFGREQLGRDGSGASGSTSAARRPAARPRGTAAARQRPPAATTRAPATAATRLRRPARRRRPPGSRRPKPSMPPWPMPIARSVPRRPGDGCGEPTASTAARTDTAAGPATPARASAPGHRSPT